MTIKIGFSSMNRFSIEKNRIYSCQNPNGRMSYSSFRRLAYPIAWNAFDIGPHSSSAPNPSHCEPQLAPFSNRSILPEAPHHLSPHGHQPILNNCPVQQALYERKIECRETQSALAEAAKNISIAVYEANSRYNLFRLFCFPKFMIP